MLYLAFWSWIIVFMLGVYTLYKRYNPTYAIKFHWVFFIVTVFACTAAYRWYWCCVSPTRWTELPDMLIPMTSYLVPGAMLYGLVLYVPEKFKKYVKGLLILSVAGVALFYAIMTFSEYRRLTVRLPCPTPEEARFLFHDSGPPNEMQNLFNIYAAECIPSETQTEN